jgi:hypothetical protein
LHEAVFAVWVHPQLGLQLSFVQTLPSSQFLGLPPTQTLLEHVSLVVQALPSSHEAVFAVFTQPVDALQLSFVQTLWSLHDLVV